VPDVQPIFVRQQDMQSVFGIYPVQLWRLLRDDPTFPQPRVLSPRRKVFEADAVRAWIDNDRRRREAAERARAERRARRDERRRAA
jgi:predicted DNA-binding transcriptional regulator AlpA